jgi:hypothetical protein
LLTSNPKPKPSDRVQFFLLTSNPTFFVHPPPEAAAMAVADAVLVCTDGVLAFKPFLQGSVFLLTSNPAVFGLFLL